MKKNLSDKYALITGASGGIGKDMAIILGSKGCNLVLVSRNEKRLLELKTELVQKNKIDVVIILSDLSVVGAAKSVFEQLTAKNIHIDILINNAGYGINDYFKNIPFEKENEMINLLIVNPLHLTKLFLPGMIEIRSGQILNVASTGAFQPTPTYASYAASKSFIMNFSVALAYELKNYGITCSCLCPGVTLTGFQEAAQHKSNNFFLKATAMKSDEVAKIALKGMFNGKKIIIPGLINQFSAFMTRLVPRYTSTKMAFNAIGFKKNDLTVE